MGIKNVDVAGGFITSLLQRVGLLFVSQASDPDTDGQAALFHRSDSDRLRYIDAAGNAHNVATMDDVGGIDTVSNATATNQNGTASITMGGNTANATATNVAEERSGNVAYFAPAAASANAGAAGIVSDVVAADGAQILAAQPGVPRKLLLFITDGDSSISAGTLDLVGVGPSGEAVSESIALTGGTASKTSTKAYAKLTSATVAGIAGNDGADKIALGVASALGLPGCKSPASSAFAVHKSAVGAGSAAAMADEAVGTVDATAGTIVPNTVPDGTKDFAFHYTFSVTPTQNAHQHAATGLTATDAGHTHTQNAHSHTLS